MVVMAVSADRVKAAREKITVLLDSTRCNPILVRLAWHDCGSYSAEASKTEQWPKAGGATASIRFKPELGKKNNLFGNDIACLIYHMKLTPIVSKCSKY